PEEQADILDEIASHIESGEEDGRLGEGPDREERLRWEMGSPGQLGRGLRGLYRPNRSGDLLWALIPYYLVTLAASEAYSLAYRSLQNPSPSDAFFMILGRVSVVVYLALLGVGWRRRSVPLMIFWLTEAAGALVMLMTRERRWVPGNELIPGSAWESILFLAGLAVLLVLLVRILRGQRYDLLWVVFALLPLVNTAANYGTTSLLQTISIYQPEVNALILSIAVRLAWTAGTAFFFLLQPREPRWFSLLLIAVSMAVPNLALYGFFPQVVVMWSGVMGVVLLGWAWDWVSRHPGRPLAE
ncbi:MAG TPA: hypothetical protein VF813_11025, partial [Anaerolineaceae bacterium]